MQALGSYKNTAKITLKLLSVPVRIVLLLTIVLLSSSKAIAGDAGLNSSQDDTSFSIQGKNILPDSTDNFSLSVRKDTLQNDSLRADTSVTVKTSRKSPLKDKVIYNSVDSMRVSMAEEKLYLFGDAYVKYQDIELKAYYIELDLDDEEVFAKGTVDTAGKAIGRPVFTQGAQNFESDSLRYNFSSENGIIYHIVSKQGEGYLHSEKTKRLSNEHIHLQDGKYTTCDAEHPHFYLALKKGIVIPEDKIVTGLAYMVIADVPIKFVGVPFGFFPNTVNRTSGILMPTYGEEQTRGFYLRDFGWYQVLGDYADLRMQGDYYTKGSWASKNMLSYKWRYHFSGSFGFNYAVSQDDDNEDIPRSTDYSLVWTHRQDPKANPTQNFSANVNFKSGNYDRNYSYNSEQYLTTKTTSSVSYTKRWPNSPFNLSLSANATQDKKTEKTLLNLPTGSFNMSSIYPFRRKSGTGQYKWYENISLTYSSSFRNELNTYNDVLFERATRDSIKSGFEHSVPLGVNFKVGKILTIGPSVNYQGRIYTRRIEYNNLARYDLETNKYILRSDTLHGLWYEHAINPGISVSCTPKLYGMLVSTKEDSYVEAIRHVMSPSASFSFTPDMSMINNLDYYDTIYTIENGAETEFYKAYNYYDQELYSPPGINGRSGSIRLALNNNLEMKVRSKSDTTGKSKKVVLLDNLNFNTSYSPFADSLRWSDVSMTTGTRLFKNKLDIRMNGSFSPYSCDSLGIKYNRFYVNETGHLLRLKTLSVSMSFSLSSSQGGREESKGSGTKKTGATEPEEDITSENTYIEDDMDYVPGSVEGTYADFDIPWSLSVQHSWSLNKVGNKTNTTHTVSLSGDFSLTPKWKIGGRTNYDIANNELSYTQLSIYRDLHCWEMRFSVIPFGERRSYSFTIQAKGSLLRDLKYEKKPNWYDNF